jgi:regulator of replication initiation timing
MMNSSRETVKQAVRVVDASIEMLKDGPEISPGAFTVSNTYSSTLEVSLGAVRSADELVQAKNISPMAPASRSANGHVSSLEATSPSFFKAAHQDHRVANGTVEPQDSPQELQPFQQDVVAAITRKLLRSQQDCALLQLENERLRRALSTSDKFIEQSKRLRATQGQRSLAKALEELESQVDLLDQKSEEESMVCFLL